MNCSARSDYRLRPRRLFLCSEGRCSLTILTVPGQNNVVRLKSRPQGAGAPFQLLFAAERFSRRDFCNSAAGGKICLQPRNLTCAVICRSFDRTLLFIFARGHDGAACFRIVAETVGRIIAAFLAEIEEQRFGFPNAQLTLKFKVFGLS